MLLSPWMTLLCLALGAALGGAPGHAPGSGSDQPSRGLLLVANKGEHTLGIVDPEVGKQIAVVPVGGVTGHEVGASPDGRTAYVPIYGDSGVGLPGTDGRSVAIIDLAARRVADTVDFGKGVRPHCAVFGPKNGLLYVTTELENAVTVIDPQTRKIVGKVPTGAAESHMLAISRDGKRGYTANVGPGTVSVLDLVGRKTVAVIPVTTHVQRISISNDDRWVFTSDTDKPRLAVIDTATKRVDRWISMPGIGYGTALTPDGRWLLVALISKNQVGVVDLSSMKVTSTIEVPAAPQEILVRPDAQTAYVSCNESRKIAALNLSEWKVEKLIDAGKGADGLAWARAIE